MEAQVHADACRHNTSINHSINPWQDIALGRWVRDVQVDFNKATETGIRGEAALAVWGCEGAGAREAEEGAAALTSQFVLGRLGRAVVAGQGSVGQAAAAAVHG